MDTYRPQPVTTGAALFSRFAFPPNLLGHCGPSDTRLVGELLQGGSDGLVELRHAVAEFAGAWPCLELISSTARTDPLDYRVVEAYWLGNSLLRGIDLQMMGNSIADRFQAQAGPEWEMVARALGSPALPNTVEALASSTLARAFGWLVAGAGFEPATFGL